MRWIADNTGRFQWRPYYEQAELDAECEQIVSAFLKAKNGAIRFPISTDDLSVMVEQDTSDLDLYADLAGMGADVEGVTDFFSNRKPAVRIARGLSLDDRSRHRLRTTLAHEFGHVRFHKFLWDATLPGVLPKSLVHQLSSQRARYKAFREKLNSNSSLTNERPVSLSLSAPPRSHRSSSGPRCRRTHMLEAPVSDWMEWQAGYISGAILMPASSVRSLVSKSVDTPSRAPDSDADSNLIARVVEAFNVSGDAARVRLTRLGILGSNPRNPP
jgi:hypothetical protein